MPWNLQGVKQLKTMATCMWKFKLFLACILHMFKGHLLRFLPSALRLFLVEGALKMSVEVRVSVDLLHTRRSSLCWRLASMVNCINTSKFVSPVMTFRLHRLNIDVKL